jgi:hypothetical protein
MTPDPVVLAATVILLLPMGYLLLAAPAFLLVKLDIPPVTILMRGMFAAYFIVLAIAAAIGTAAVALAGRLGVAAGIGLIAAFAILWRPWFLERMDAALSLRDAGHRDAVRTLRRLHWGGMLVNAVQCVAIVGSIPLITAP